MQDIEIFARLLRLDNNWHVKSVEIDEPSNRLDLVIGHGKTSKKAFFNRSKSLSDTEYLVLRHLPVAGMRTYLHIPASEVTAEDRVWKTAGSSLTKEMENHLVEVLNNSVSKHAAATISGISLADVRKVSERTGAGTNVPEAVTNVANTGSDIDKSVITGQAESKSFEIVDDSVVPSETHPNWQRLINGEIALGSTSVALQMLLQRVRKDISKNPNEITRMNSARILRQFFIKNQGQHKAEIALIKGNATQATGSAGENLIQSGGGLPPESNELWIKIVSGEKSVSTKNIALQMMMERLRHSIQQNPSEASYQAGIKILRQFFVKHQSSLHTEISQLGVNINNNTSTGILETFSSDDLPAENDSCWQLLIDGKIKIQTNAVGLQMMIERLRQSVANNNTSVNRQAAIKILRQYFSKHLHSTDDELKQLRRLGTKQQNSSGSSTGVPSETHPNWQRMIDGELELNTDTVALKMMLQSIRISIENNPSQASRHAGAKILRQYFIKHQGKHKTELEQLIAA